MFKPRHEPRIARPGASVSIKENGGLTFENEDIKRILYISPWKAFLGFHFTVNTSEAWTFEIPKPRSEKGRGPAIVPIPLISQVFLVPHPTEETDGVASQCCTRISVSRSKCEGAVDSWPIDNETLLSTHVHIKRIIHTHHRKTILFFRGCVSLYLIYCPGSGSAGGMEFWLWPFPNLIILTKALLSMFLLKSNKILG